MADAKGTSVLKDPRVDRVMTWVLALFVTVALAFGSSTFSELKAEMRTLNQSVNGLHTSVKVLERSTVDITEIKDDLKKVRERLRWLEINATGARPK